MASETSTERLRELMRGQQTGHHIHLPPVELRPLYEVAFGLGLLVVLAAFIRSEILRRRRDQSRRRDNALKKRTLKKKRRR